MAEFDWKGKRPRTGDQVRFVGDDGICDTSICEGDLVTVIEVRDDGTQLHFKTEDGDTCTHELDCFEPLNKERIMSDVKTLVKNTKLTADDRLLRKEGLEDENGNMTSTGKDLMLERLWAAERTKIAAEVKAARAQEKAENDTDEDD